MDFESPDVMKDFPGLYACDLSKKGNNDSDYSDDTDKITKKDLLIGKRKDKKDKKDKERGYATLEGESSAEESHDARSPSKSKKTKSFKFTTKSKEKREKSRDKELVDKKKDKLDKKLDKKLEKEKKSDKKERKSKHCEEYGDIADGLPIFGVNLDLAIKRARCHDGIDLPLPIRACVDHVTLFGLAYEGVYKITGAKSKVLQLRKMFNCREHVDLTGYDIPTVTSLLKMYLRELPESIFTNDLLVRFEEAGAILNVSTREKHLKILVDSLPKNNKLSLSWLLVHFENVIANEVLNKVSLQTLVSTLSPVFRISTRLLTGLLYHCRLLFPDVIPYPYIPPLTSTEQLPDEPALIETELKKQESLLLQIHTELHAGFISPRREELMWEVQRIITQLKRKYKNVQKDKYQGSEKVSEDQSQIVSESEESNDYDETTIKEEKDNDKYTSVVETNDSEPSSKTEDLPCTQKDEVESENKCSIDSSLLLMQIKNSSLVELKESLLKAIEIEKNEIVQLKKQLQEEDNCTFAVFNGSTNLDEIMDLLSKENQILQIKKINLVRQIMEQQEICIDMKAKITLLGA